MDFIQQAYRGHTKLWMFLFTAAAISGVFIFNFVSFLTTDPSDLEAVYDMMGELPPLLNLTINLIPFAFLLGALFFLVKFLHERSITSLTTSRPKIDWSRFRFSFFLVSSISLVGFVLSYFADPTQYVLQFDWLKFSLLFLVSILLFPFQIGLEEYLFRGYFMQHLGIIVKNRWFPLMFTSLFFGLAHSANPEVAELGMVTMTFYIGTGLFLGICTLMDEGLELALGFHLGNNLLAALMVTADYSALKTDAVFRLVGDSDTVTLFDIVLPILIYYPILLLVFSKKYGWTNWKNRLTGRVVNPNL